MADVSDDFGLLRQYVEYGDEAAFARIVSRHTDMVWSAARRQVGAGHLADEITQATFVLLLRKADRLPPGTIVAGWLYKAARYAAANAVRAETRRRKHERKAASMAVTAKPTGQAWGHVAPHLDEAIARLRPSERAVVVLRFLERRSMAEVGLALGCSEHAAQMRVTRALEKMREFFARKGVAMTAGALAVVIASHASEAAPPALAQSLTIDALRTANVAPGPTAALADGAARDLAVGQARGAAAFACAVVMVLLLGVAAVQSKSPDGPDSPDRSAERPADSVRPTPAAVHGLVR